MNKRRKRRISTARSYRELGEFWDTHELAEYWDQTEPVEVTMDLKSELTYYALDTELATQIRRLARRRGVSPETLLNLWVQEKLQEQRA